MTKKGWEKVVTSVSKSPGRPRSEEAHRRILKATYELVSEIGFNQLTMEAIAVRAKVGKPTIYRRWSSKAHLVGEAFFSPPNQEWSYSDTDSAKKNLRWQMYHVVNLMSTPHGQIIAALIGGGQADPELINAFRENWLTPTQQFTAAIIKKGIKLGEFPNHVNLQTTIDVIYGGVFFRLMIKHAPLTHGFVDELIDLVLKADN